MFTKNKKFCVDCYDKRRRQYRTEWKRKNWQEKPGYADAMNAKDGSTTLPLGKEAYLLRQNKEQQRMD